MDPAFCNFCRVDECRVDVYNTIWDTILNAIKKISRDTDFSVTLRSYSLGDRDATTKWRAVTYPESTIEMVVAAPRSTRILAVAGTYVRTDALGLTIDPVKAHDQIKTATGDYYEVTAVRDQTIGDSGVYAECDLSRLTMYGE